MALRKTLFILFFIISATGFSQEAVSTNGNTLTLRQIAPVWPGCEGTKAEKKTCFNQKLIAHIKEAFQYQKDADGKIIRGKSVVSFYINEKGLVDIIKVEGEKEALNKEAKRIILAIPQMKPGQLAGKATSVKYTIPFTF